MPEAPKHTPSLNPPRDVGAAESIVFFDGVCGFCNRSVNTLMARDRHHRLRFAPLQGATAQERLSPEFTTNLDTLVFLHNGRIYTRSTAVVRILWTLGGISAVAAVLLWLIPRPFRNLGYRGFAKIRYRLFGKHESCRLPTPEERDLILK